MCDTFHPCFYGVVYLEGENPYASIDCSAWRAAAREAPHELARCNVISGLAWAVAMVNIQQPQIMATLLRYQGEQLSTSDAFANGVAASVMMRSDTTPEASFLMPFYHYQPDPSDPGLVQLWNSQVGEPCQEALQQVYPVLQAHQRLGEIFRYQSFPELVAQLQRAPQTDP